MAMNHHSAPDNFGSNGSVEVLSRLDLPEEITSAKLLLQQQDLLSQYKDRLESQQQQLLLQEKQLQSQQDQLDRFNDLLDEPQVSMPWAGWDFNQFLRQFWQGCLRSLTSLHGSDAYQPRFSLPQVLLSYVGSFIGIAALAYISVNTPYPLIAAPFGAAAVLVFAVPSSPLTQPRNLIFGNLIGAIVSLVMVSLFGTQPWVMALAVATSIKLMQLTKTLHPPGGAVALVGVMSNAQWSFLFTPVLTGSIVLLFCTVLFNNVMPGRSYPQHWL
jgi:hypothetical protein